MSCLLVVQPSVSHYRARLIKELGVQSDIDFRLVGKYQVPSDDPRDHVEEADAGTLRAVGQLPFIAKGRWTWERDLVGRALRGRYDVVVLEGRIFTVSTWLILVLRRVLGRRTLLWTQGWRSADVGSKRFARIAFYRLATGLLLYGPRAFEIGRRFGYPAERMWIIHNSIYGRAELGARLLTGTDRDRFLNRMGLDPSLPTVISVSRLAGRKGMARLLHAALELQNSGVALNLLIVGEGAERSSLEAEASSMGLNCRFLGGVYDFETLASLYSVADCAIVAGAAGLSVIQSLGFGVPIVVSSNDAVNGPETDAVVPHHNGWVFDDSDPRSLTETLRLATRRHRTPSVADTCVSSVRADWTAEAQARAICDAVGAVGRR